MSIYNWDGDLRQLPDGDMVNPITKSIPGIQQLDDIQSKKVELLGEFTDQYSAYVREDVPVAFHALERALKHYFSDIPVPAKDHVRFMQVQVSGGKRATLYWNQSLQEGKAHLPVAAISSTKDYEFNYEKYSMPYFPMRIRYLNSSRTKCAKVFRPLPVLINYTITVLAEHKRDMGYIQTHLLRRFNPYAEIMMDDGRVQGTVQLYYKGASNTTEEEVGFDQEEMISWELRFQADAWLPLPELVTSTVRGTVSVWRERCETFSSLSVPAFLDFGV